MFRNNKKATIGVLKAKRQHESKHYVFNGCKQRNKMWLVSLEGKLQEDSYGRPILTWKCLKMLESLYLGTSKKQTMCN